jgi:chromate reductase, NAD(P)H dehydrogenase (quinone)
MGSIRGKPGHYERLSWGNRRICANHHLSQSMVFLNAPTMQQPEAYIGNAGSLFDENGKLASSFREFATKYMLAFLRDGT